MENIIFGLDGTLRDSTEVPFLMTEDGYQLITDNNTSSEINPF